MPDWFKKAVGWFIAIAIVFIAMNALIHDPTGSAEKVRAVASGVGQVFKFFESL